MGISLGQRTFNFGLKTNVSNADAVESAIIVKSILNIIMFPKQMR